MKICQLKYKHYLIGLTYKTHGGCIKSSPTLSGRAKLKCLPENMPPNICTESCSVNMLVCHLVFMNLTHIKRCIFKISLSTITI